MPWSDLPLNPSERMLRQFSALWIVLLCGLAVWHGLVHHEPRVAAILIAFAVAGTPGLVAPKWMRPVFVAMTIAGWPIGWVVSRVVLLLISLAPMIAARSTAAATAVKPHFVLDSEAGGPGRRELFQAVLTARSPRVSVRRQWPVGLRLIAKRLASGHRELAAARRHDQDLRDVRRGVPPPPRRLGSDQYRVALCELNVLIAVGQRQPAFHDDRELIHARHRRMLAAGAAARQDHHQGFERAAAV